MTDTVLTQRPAPRLDEPTRKTRGHSDPAKGSGWRFLFLTVITLVVMIPIAVVFYLGLQPRTLSAGYDYIFGNVIYVLQGTFGAQWLLNSLLVTLATTLFAVVVSAPGGYVLSRGRGKVVGGYSLTLFIVQSVPIIASVIPLFFLFANIGLVDSLVGAAIVYIGSTVSVATWMMGAYFDSIPRSLEEAAWIDGASRFGGFTRIVLRNSLPGILSVAIFSFLLSWNDFLVALVFLRSDANFTSPLGLLTFFQQETTDWGGVMGLAILMLIPPVLIFSVFNKYFSVGGIGGALAGR